MSRIIAGLLALFMLGPPCWAQASTTSAPSSFAGKRIAQIVNRLAPLKQSAAVASSTPGSNGIAYNGGPIMDDANGVNVYYIWYGDWSHDRDAQKILVNLIAHIGGSPYFNINTTYYSFEPGPSGSKVVKDRVINAVHYMGSADDHYSQGASLSDYQVYQAVANAITSGVLPADPNGVYFLLTSADVNETSGFGTAYCAWHDSTADLGFPSVDGVDVKLAFVGNAETQYAYACIYDYQTPLSGSLGADGMASFIAHELEEAVTDPDATSWINPNSGVFGENADMCASTYGSASHSGSAADPYPPNMYFKGIPYLIQQNWVNAKGGYCALKWDE